MSNLSIEQKLTMSLDEIMIEELKEKIVKLEKKCDKQMFKNDILVETLENLRYSYKQLENKYNEMTEITNLYNWVIHIDSDSREYASGYRYNNSKLFDTSYILHKIPQSTYLIVITENESLYLLPYSESYK
jgi:type III secretion system FlhB-like substrate exporter|tara:strand:+ start:149 stop:541 length:393 start_codon:yes stop_codon:yes gene_type:complete